MTNEAKAPAAAPPQQADTSDKAEAARSVLAQQQENDNSDDEEFLSDTAEVVDANDVTQYTESLNLDLKKQDDKVWLVRLPRFLAEHWRNRENLQGQTLGTIKIKKDVKDKVMKLHLADTMQTHDLPHDYELRLTQSAVENQYVFAEKNYVRPVEPVKAEGDDEEEEETKEMTVAEKEFQRRLKFIQRKKRRFNKFKNKDGTDRIIPFVKTIPKNTAMKGTIVNEAQLIPSIRDPNYSKIIAARQQYFKEEPRSSVTLLQEHSGVSLSNAGLTLKTDTSTFLKTADPKKNKQENRATRMDRTQLLNLLFKMFDEYDYWSLKGLKERTKQPEVYLKEVLDSVATLIKKGPYVLKYALKKEYKELKDQDRMERLGSLANGDDEEEEDENDEDMVMEDVA